MFKRKHNIKMSTFEIILMWIAGFTLGSIIGTFIMNLAIKFLGL
ncbi:hypothetical protein X915_gp072 [Bacillus phage vB_BanS-Tsamsa]|uniref:Uncharacterized protein n=1 Tax=Bacillus phage vB_BanS-Tsamsa TaxID=1308863 RepID=U5J9L9_9CAUD|nr:hypothetical protein X915_gp072 [Bacillus phage vB_BanS-Tsamsa]AGI11983.1 hypothetical protein [Bacillus phage vB_BanS-Tsamsa]